MQTVLNVIYAIVLFCVLFYTASYCRYEFKNKNTVGAAAVLILCIAVLLVPIAVYVADKFW